MFRYYSERNLRDDVDDSRLIDCHLVFFDQIPFFY